jgi:hypothetical protein
MYERPRATVHKNLKEFTENIRKNTLKKLSENSDTAVTLI